MKQRLVHLDVFRGFAILGVLLFHSIDAVYGQNSFPYSGALRKITFDFDSPTAFWLYPSHLGYLGVAMFFAISGFCIHYSQIWSKTPRPGLVFFAKRFFRIVPVYFLVLMLLAIRRVHWGTPESFKGFILHVFLIHNFSVTNFFALNPSFWSIAVEMQLYLLYPLIWYCARCIGWRRTLVTTLIVEMALRSLEAYLGGVNRNFLPIWVKGSPFYFWFSWTAGAYAAEMHNRGSKLPKSILAGWFCFFGGLMADIWTFSSEFSFTMVAAGTAILLRSDWNVPSRFRKWPILLGGWSYSLYLIHQPILQKVGELLVARNDFSAVLSLTSVWIVAVFLVGVAAIMYNLMELPSVEVGRRVLGKIIAFNSRKIVEQTGNLDAVNSSETQ